MNIEYKTLAKASDDYLKLVTLASDSPHGALLSYDYVEGVTKVRMDIPGKDKLRRAILKSGREYAVIRGIGYKLADVDSAVYIVTDKLQRIDNSTKRGERAYKVLNDQFGGQLPEANKKYFLFIGNIYGAIRLAAEQGKKIYSRGGKVLTAGENIQIPDIK